MPNEDNILRPITLVSYGRSGTSLVHNILAAHPDIEGCGETMPLIFAETERLLKPGGIVLHVEQPQYSDEMPLFEQAMRDWDAFYNNEPFWTKMHEVDLDDWMEKAGFSRDSLIHGGVAAVVDPDVFPEAAEDDEQEDYGRKAAWHVIGARKEG